MALAAATRRAIGFILLVIAAGGVAAQEYLVQSTVLDWPDSEESCRAYGRTLVRVDSPEALDDVVELMVENNITMIYIGLNDRANEGDFVWSGDTDVYWRANMSIYAFKNFSTNEPNDLFGEDCVMMRSTLNAGGYWNDQNCDLVQASICGPIIPTPSPTYSPTAVPSPLPTAVPSPMPTAAPTLLPTAVPTLLPTAAPSPLPTASPSPLPTAVPTLMPTAVPSPVPTVHPSPLPTAVPTPQPTASPTPNPTDQPTSMPTAPPSPLPTVSPTATPTNAPTLDPTAVPTPQPTSFPTSIPTALPTPMPTSFPTPPPSPSPVVEVLLILPLTAIPNKDLTVQTNKHFTTPDGEEKDDDFDPAVTYTWYSNTFDLEDGDVLLTDRNVPYIRIHGSAVKGDVDRVHIGLRYSVENQLPEEVSIERFIPIDAAPFGGSCSSSNLTGEALSTPFVLSCFGWQDDGNTQLQYRFSQVLASREFPKRLGVFSDKPSLEVTLPQGQIQLLAEIRDEHGATTEYHFDELIDVKQLNLVDVINGRVPTPMPTLTVPTPMPSIDVGNETGTTSTTGATTGTTTSATVISTPAPTIVRNPQLDQFVSTTLSEALENTNDTEPNTETPTAEEKFVQAYIKIDSVSDVLNGIEENATSVSVEQLSDLRNDAFEAFTTALNPLANSDEANATALSGGVVTMSLQLMVDLSEPELQVTTDLRDKMIDTTSELLVEAAAPASGGDASEDADLSTGDVLNTASLVISLIGELSETEHTDDATAQEEFAGKVSTTISQVADGISATLLPTQKAVEVVTPKLGLYVKVEEAIGYQKEHNFRGFNATFPEHLFDDSCATAVGLSVIVSENAFHPVEKGNNSSANSTADARDPFDEYADAVASMMSISRTIRVEFSDQGGNCSRSGGGGDNALLQEPIEKVNKELPIRDLDPCEPIVLRIPIADEFLGLNFSQYQPVCRHRDEQSARAVSNCVPDADNIAQLKIGNATHLVCRCNHLTFFDAGWEDYIPEFNVLTEEDIRDFTFENLQKHPTGVYVTGGLLVFFLALLCWGIYLDNYTLARNRKEKTDRHNRVAFFRDSDILAHVITRKLESENKALPRLAYGVWMHCVKNYHRWTAIFLRDKHSSFQSKDRVVVVYAFVLSTLAISAVFYGRQTDQSLLLIALISAVAAGVPAYLFKWLFCRCRISDDQQDVNAFNLDQALNNTKRMTFVDALDVLEKERNHGWGRFAFAQRAVTRVRTRTHRRTKSGGNFAEGEAEAEAEVALDRGGLTDGRESDRTRDRRDSNVPSLSGDLDDSDDEEVFKYVWNVGLPMGAAFDVSDDEWSSDEEGKDHPVEYASDSDSGCAEREEKRVEANESDERLNDGGAMASQKTADDVTESVISQSDSLTSLSGVDEASKKDREHQKSTDVISNDRETSVDSLPEISLASNVPESPHTQSDTQLNSPSSSVTRHTQTAKVSGLQNMQRTLKFVRRFVSTESTHAGDGYGGLTATMPAAAPEEEAASEVRRRARRSSDPPSHRRSKQKTPRRSRSGGPKGGGKSKKKSTTHHRRASYSIRALQRNLTASRTASREKLARVLRPPRPSQDEEKQSERQLRSRQLDEDTRFHALMLPTLELMELEHQPTLSGSAATGHTRSNSLSVPGRSGGPPSRALTSHSTTPRTANMLPERAHTLTPSASGNPTFKLRSTGKPLAWLMDDLRGREIKDARDDDEDGAGVVSEAEHSFVEVRNAFESRRRSVTISKSVSLREGKDESSTSATGGEHSLSEQKQESIAVNPPPGIFLDIPDTCDARESKSHVASAFEIEDARASSIDIGDAMKPTDLRQITVDLTPSSPPEKRKPNAWRFMKRRDRRSETPRGSSGTSKLPSDGAKSSRRPWSFRRILRRESAQREDGFARRRRSRGSWPPWVRWVVFSLSVLWALGCTFIVLLFSLQFDLTSNERSYYDAYTCHDASADVDLEAATMTTTGSWLGSFAASAALDMFAIQPVLLLGFAAVKIKWQSRKRRRKELLRRQFSAL